MNPEHQEISQEDLSAVLELVQKRYGFDFTQYARSSMKRRMQRIMENFRLPSVFELKHKLLNDELFFEVFVEEITVNVTEMFRDPFFYKELREKVIPQLESYPSIKIWHAGCSSGEEVYSLAILLHECGLLERSRIYATDINSQVLNRARAGIFDLRYMKDYTLNYIAAGGTGNFSDYYTAKYDQAIFKKELKEHMIFSIHNLVADKSFNEFNLILCRNVLIYFNEHLQNQVISLFSESLCPFGYLALGSKESLLFYRDRDRYEMISKISKLFKLVR
jgi:chemotaxis protein methyltransferase CheR